MSDESWYAACNNEQIGPLAFEALRQMVSNQELGSTDLVWQIGTPSWVPASQVPALCEVAGWGDPRVPSLPLQAQYRPHLQDLRSRVGELDQTAGALEALPHLRFIRRMLETLGRQVTTHQLDLGDRLMKRAGSVSYVLAAVFYGAFFAVMSLKADSIQQLLATLLIVIPSASVCHFIAVHFIESGEDMLRQTATELSSKTLAMSLGLVSGTVGLLALIGAGHDLVQKIDVVEAILAIAIGLLLLYAAAVCLNPQSLNVTVEAREHAAREAIGISMFLAKIPLRLIPAAFGLFSMLAAGFAIFFCYQLATSEQLDLRYAQALEVAPRALLIGLLPMALYLTAVLAVLLVDFFRASLDTPEEIRNVAEALKRTESPQASVANKP